MDKHEEVVKQMAMLAVVEDYLNKLMEGCAPDRVSGVSGIFINQDELLRLTNGVGAILENMNHILELEAVAQ